VIGFNQVAKVTQIFEKRHDFAEKVQVLTNFFFFGLSKGA
jgi:hypothetical protein